jgi:cohesin loading factor subunit SCC2
MASQPPGAQNGGANGQPPPGAGEGVAQFDRPFTLYEALPFSPFTSVIPFQPGPS